MSSPFSLIVGNEMILRCLKATSKATDTHNAKAIEACNKEWDSDPIIFHRQQQGIHFLLLTFVDFHLRPPTYRLQPPLNPKFAHSPLTSHLVLIKGELTEPWRPRQCRLVGIERENR
ncbi:hypothetical protein L1987_01463 [Smallanthus sonchifolius]|uniref:Uncharacterized protein n=1 Tax=Smallanthus sonchifolius TaxID=185202 RepID=A0ACB9K5E0_9ASTR|nr:hypothetical protein L1987_01463 [Smallanthus sonchifolius]